MAQGHDIAAITDHRVNVQLGRNRGIDRSRQVPAKTLSDALWEAKDGRAISDMPLLSEIQQQIN